jgi:hypothetical protein
MGRYTVDLDNGEAIELPAASGVSEVPSIQAIAAAMPTVVSAGEA